MEMARTGQGRTQAPHPVQLARLTTGVAPPPSFGLKEIAFAGQLSSQTRQTTPFGSTQSTEMAAVRPQGLVSRGEKQGSLQASAHLPQNVHSAFEKSAIGYPAWPFTSTPVGQADRQLPQRVQASWNASSRRVHGGRICSGPPRKRAKRARLEPGVVECSFMSAFV